MSGMDTSAFRVKLRRETVEQLTERVVMWTRVLASSDHASKVRAKLLELTNAEIARRTLTVQPVAGSIQVGDAVTGDWGDGRGEYAKVVTHVVPASSNPKL